MHRGRWKPDGKGCIVLNGAVIGRDCLVAAGSLIASNKIIPDRSLVMGSPAKVVRSLRDEEVAQLQANAARYVEKATRFAQTLRLVHPFSESLGV
jgi:carbonic anhydrase/acetyltransferase-like protein (isoleucine patch superfamily)